jgi:hypothetical protein
MVEATDEDHQLAEYLKRVAAMAAHLWIEPDSRHRAISALCQQATWVSYRERCHN